MEYELCIREAEISDATALIAFLDCVGQETDFTSLDENGIMMTASEMALFIEKQAGYPESGVHKRRFPFGYIWEKGNVRIENQY